MTTETDRCATCGQQPASSIHATDSENIEIRFVAHEFVDRHHLTLQEERDWKRLKNEPNTREDWEDLNALITAFRRRFVERHRGRT